MPRYLVDTNILIDDLRGEHLSSRFLQDVESCRVLGTISVQIWDVAIFPTRTGDISVFRRRLTSLIRSVILISAMRHIEFTSLIFKEGETFVSYCPELRVASCGDTIEETRRRLLEAVRLFLEESQRMGTLQDILHEEGFVPRDLTGASWTPPPLIATEHMQLAF